MIAHKSILYVFCVLGLVLLTSSTHQPDHTHTHSCAHDTLEFEPIILALEESDRDSDFIPGRLLQTTTTTTTTTTTFPNMRFSVDYSTLKSNNSALDAYVSKNLFPPVIDYFTKALKVKKPTTANIKLPNVASYKNLCGVAIPDSYFTTGVAADMAIVVVAVNEPASSFVATATSCLLDSTTKRPYFAKVTLNLARFGIGNTSTLHEQNIYTLMHELTHALGFSGGMFQYFLDANGVQRTGHISYSIVNGKNVSVLNVEPLTSRLRAHYGCSNVTGAIMENDGGSGTLGSHFERKIFINEYMTGSVMTGMRISEFSLALLEGSGWYVPDYTFAEPFYAGAGEGCGYVYGTCNNAAGAPNFVEYCNKSDTSLKCGANRRGGAMCTSDSMSDGCSFTTLISRYDCTNAANADTANVLKTEQKFGPTAGSKCFTGTITGSNSYFLSRTAYCLTYTCTNTGLATVLNVNIGAQTAICKAEGPITITGMAGLFDCPDPIEFCATVGQTYCPRGCMGRGKCQNNKCVCNAGFAGADCSENISTTTA